MKCVICKHGETVDGHTTVTLERRGVTLIFKNVPAKLCDNCGESYIADQVSERLLAQAEEAMKLGVQLNISEYKAA